MIFTDNRDINEVKRNWKSVFGDGDDFLDGLFSLSPTVFGIKTDGRVSSSLLVIEMRYNAFRVGYIYGAMTLEEYRKQGQMKKLIREACETLEREGFSAVFLLPATEKLYKYYAKCGFEKNLPVDTAVISQLPQGDYDRIPDAEEYKALCYPVKRDYPLFEFAVKTHLENGGHTVCKGNEFIAYHINEGQVICDMSCDKNIKRDRYAMSVCFNGFKWSENAHIGLLME